MPIETIRQSACAIKDAYHAYKELLQRRSTSPDSALDDKIVKTKNFILKLLESIKKAVDEERENVG